MDPATPLEIFLVCTPGLEAAVADEARERGFAGVALVDGGVTLTGDWPDIWRANLELRGPTRVLVRIASFRAMHLAQLDKRARKLAWGEYLRPDVPVSVEATCRKSKIYHAGAAAQRVATAIREELGAPIDDKAELRILARIEDDLVTISIDTTGESLHKRGHKEAVNRAPMRETMAAMFLRQCGYVGTEPVLDPMCGSGTFVIEAAEIAAGLKPGRTRSFAFEQLRGFDPAAWQAMRATTPGSTPDLIFHGSDRDTGAVAMSRENAERAGVSFLTRFTERAIADLERPEGPPGLVIINPPYGTRIGDRGALTPTYRTMGQVLLSRFSGWRVGIIATDKGLVNATGLPFLPPGPPVLHGGLRVTLWRTAALK
ncbi:MAG: THUMP domain-containing class I SAM-dependent RNA methyltransferase [Devosia sp.]